MERNFYGQWFNRTQPKRRTPEELWQEETEQLRSLATSPFAEQLVERFEVLEVDAAEEAFKAAIEQIADPEIRNAIDMAAGKISRAYQILGFCVGRFSKDSRAQIF